MSFKSDLIGVVLACHGETANALLVSDDGDAERSVWLPKSQIEFERCHLGGGAVVDVTLPYWLAEEKGLI